MHVIDTATEFRHETNGKFEDRTRSAKAGQLDMARYYRVPAMSQKTKEAGRQHGKERPTTAHEWQQLLAYNAGDVRDLSNLFQAMLSQGAIHPARALLAGRYLKAVARIERTGVPIDIPTYDQIVAHHQEIVRRIIREIDKDYGIYDDKKFKLERFGAYLARVGIEWRRTATGRLSTSADVFEDQAKLYPAELRPLAELRQTDRAAPQEQAPGRLGLRRPQSGIPLAVLRDHGAQPTPWRAVDLPAVTLVPVSDPGATRDGARLPRLGSAGDRHRRQALGRSSNSSACTPPATRTSPSGNSLERSRRMPRSKPTPNFGAASRR